MDLIDIHSHRLPVRPRTCIVNALYSQYKDISVLARQQYFSVGIHPWMLDALDKQEAWLEEILKTTHPLAVGEAGLDRNVDCNEAEQIELLKKHVVLSEQYGLPLILHVVKMQNEIIRLHKLWKPLQTWIIHGFRGSPGIMEQYINEGICLSYGEKYNKESLARTPHEKLFFETDESEVPILEIYEKAAAVRGTSTSLLMNEVQTNIQNVFFKD